MPPWASGPVFTVSRPILMGTFWAMAVVGKWPKAAAAPAAVLASNARRLTLRAIVFPPFSCSLDHMERVRVPHQALLPDFALLGPHQAAGLSTSSAADSPANRPDARGIPAPARSRTD